MNLNPEKRLNKIAGNGISIVGGAEAGTPTYQVNASAGADIYKSDRVNMKSQIDGQNLTNVFDVIDFGGLFSGNAIGPTRSFALRLTTSF